MLTGADKRGFPAGAAASTRGSTTRSQILQFLKWNNARRQSLTTRSHARTREYTTEPRYGGLECREAAWKEYIYDSFHPEKVSASLGYTWLTHWRLVEEDRLSRLSIVESVRRRQNERNKEMVKYVYGSGSQATGMHPQDKCPPLEGDNNFEPCIIHGRLGISMAGSSNLDVDLDELSWLASHPNPQEINLSADNTPSMLAAVAAVDSDADELLDSLTRPIAIEMGGNFAMVRPLWISVHNKADENVALLFESMVPLSPEVIENISSDLTPFCSISGFKFSEMADLQYSSWSNYFVGVVGEVGTEEVDILWPNQILHRDRVLYNMRNGLDIARFLADPTRKDVDLHLANLQRLARERRYHPTWCWHMLRARWGEKQLRRLGMEPSSCL
jgi:hypothetical protein